MKARRIELDFGSQRRTPQAAALVTIAIGLVLASIAAYSLAGALQRRQLLLAQADRLDAVASRSARPAARPVVDPRTVARARAAGIVVQSLQRPWDDLLEAVEQLPRGDVALLAVEPSAQKHSVRITAEARTESAMLSHLQMLQQDSRLSEVALISHQRQLQAPGTPWRYQIQGSW